MDLRQRATREEVSRALAALARTGGNRYILNMWREALQAQVTNPSGRAVTAGGALPYLPIDPSDYAVVLTSRSRVLDIGCLGGYGLYDLFMQCEKKGTPVPELVGVDRDEESIAIARRLASIWAQGVAVSFHPGRAEKVLLGIGTFDIVICRLVLPYTKVKQAMQQIGLLCKEGGIVIVQVHAAWYYARQMQRNRGSLRRLAYYVRPLLHGLWMQCTGWQLLGRWFGEMAISHRLLRRLARAEGLQPVRTFGDRERPLYVLQKKKADASLS